MHKSTSKHLGISCQHSGGSLAVVGGEKSKEEIFVTGNIDMFQTPGTANSLDHPRSKGLQLLLVCCHSTAPISSRKFLGTLTVLSMDTRQMASRPFKSAPWATTV